MKRIAIVVFCMVMLAHLLFASDSTGTRGGGDGITVNGKTKLRDLIEQSNCEWFTGAQFAASLPDWKPTLYSLENANWILAQALEQEARKLSICLTNAPLKQFPTQDQDGLTIYVPPGGIHQIAIRWEDRVYIDRKTLHQMDDVGQTYLFLHEVFHSFIPMGVSQRNMKLRSVIAMARKNELHPMDPFHFGYQLEKADVQVVIDSTVLNEAATLIKSVGDQQAGLVARLRSARALRDLLGKTSFAYLSGHGAFIDLPDPELSDYSLEKLADYFISFDDTKGLRAVLELGINTIDLSEKAVRQNAPEVLAALLEFPLAKIAGMNKTVQLNSVDDDYTCPWGTTALSFDDPLVLAIQLGRANLFRKLAEDPRKLVDRCVLWPKGNRAIPILFYAVQEGQSEIARYLIDQRRHSPCPHSLSARHRGALGWGAWETSSIDPSLLAAEREFQKSEPHVLSEQLRAYQAAWRCH